MDFDLQFEYSPSSGSEFEWWLADLDDWLWKCRMQMEIHEINQVICVVNEDSPFVCPCIYGGVSVPDTNALC